MQYLKIQQIRGRTILDSRGIPTVEVDVLCEGGIMGRAAAPSGVSTGSHEALEMRDGESHHYLGQGVNQALKNIREKIAPSLIGQNAFLQRDIDQQLCELDGTYEKKNLGANATSSVSLAIALAAAQKNQQPLYRYLGGTNPHRLPIPMMNVINGGQHAPNNLDFQEFMIVCHGFSSFHEALRAGAETYQNLRKLFFDKQFCLLVGDEGGLAAPEIQSHRQALDLMTEAIEKAGYRLGEQISFALDIASSEFYQPKTASYHCKGLTDTEPSAKTSEQMIQIYQQLTDQYPIVSVEDGLAEDDWAGWQKLTATLGKKIALIGDDLLVTNPQRLRRAMDCGAANGILIKINQIGTLSETMDCITLAQSAGWKTIVSHRSGETEDTSIAHLAVATATPFIKTGAPCRSERTAKYNMLLRIEENLGRIAQLASLPTSIATATMAEIEITS